MCSNHLLAYFTYLLTYLCLLSACSCMVLIILTLGKEHYNMLHDASDNVV